MLDKVSIKFAGTIFLTNKDGVGLSVFTFIGIMQRVPVSFKKLYVQSVVLLLVAVIIKIVSLFPGFIEHVYLPYVYRLVAYVFRLAFGWVPFSVGDVLYGFVAGLTIYYLVRVIVLLVRKQITKKQLKYIMLRLGVFVLTVYVYFNLAWGLNYNRQGIAYQLSLNPQSYTKADLTKLTAELIEKVNIQRSFFADSIIKVPADENIFAGAVTAYQQSIKPFPFLNYQAASVKRSYFGWLGNVVGFLGYYNPFTGEAQVNTTIPRFLLPSVTCHEMGHQLGYASESEANFVGYLTATQSPDHLFNYSACF